MAIGKRKRRQPVMWVTTTDLSTAASHPFCFVTVENLVAGLSGNPELGAQRRHLLALEQAGDKPESLA
jgi:hypothetical protein